MIRRRVSKIVLAAPGEEKVTDDIGTGQPAHHSNLLLTLPTQLWRHVLTFHGYKDHTLAGRACQYLKRLWKEALHNHRIAGTLFVPGHCNTLKEAVERVHGDDGLTTIVVGKAWGKGEHQIDGYYLRIASAMNIVGDPGVPKSEIVVVGGVKFEEGIQGICHLQHLTLRQAMLSGVYGKSSFTMEDVLVEQCGTFGVVVDGTGVLGRCTNVEVYHCGRSGVVAFDGASITLIGAKTTVHHNCTKGAVDEYGLKVFGPSSTIQLVSTLTKEQKEQKEQVSTLTKEQVSIDNGGGGNWGAEYGGYINQIKTMTEAEMLAVLAARSRGEVRVPEDCATLEEALQQVHGDDVLTTIVVGKGEHQIDDGYLEIFSAMTIVGDPGVPKSEIVVIGGIFFREGIQGNCHLQHMTLRQATESGVIGQSSFTMEDVLVEQCVNVGVVAYGNVGRDVVGRCTNVEVRQCGGSGVVAMNGGSITLIGANTTVHHNCTRGKSDDYGLQVWGFSGQQTIQLVFPLTKEQVSIDNSGGGNWGAGMFAAINQIKTITL
jgi:hypothetical protein